jgi:hypothetical protein
MTASKPLSSPSGAFLAANKPLVKKAISTRGGYLNEQ